MSNVLVIDGGGRGSVLVQKYSQSPDVTKIYAIPGNDLMSINTNKQVSIFPHIKTTEKQKILKIVKKEAIDIIDVAQDDAIESGLVNLLKKNKFKVIGPTREAGQIEWDKAYSRKFMKKYNIPHPAFKICSSESTGLKFIKKQKDTEWYIKAAGLAAGKGAIYAANNKQALNAIAAMKQFKKAGKTYLIEECLHGEEFSSFAIVSNHNVQIVGHAQDHKTVYDKNTGPNTGGMGCSSPPYLINKNIENQIKLIFKKTALGLEKEKRPYTGILYLGGMVTNDNKIKIIEFNARWGDPEAQVIIPSIKNDFYKLANNIASGKKTKIIKDKKYRIAVTAALKGYPQNYQKAANSQIHGIEKIQKLKNITIYSAGIKRSGQKYMAVGGRILYIVSEGENVIQARRRAYSALTHLSVSGNNLHYRKDIGYRDVERLK